MKELMLRDRLILALDEKDDERRFQILRELGPEVGWIKLNSAVFESSFYLVEMLKNANVKIFLDMKWKDIPRSVERNALWAANYGINMFNVHIDGGSEMMKAAMKGAAGKILDEDTFIEGAGVCRPIVLGVTLLTSMDTKSLWDDFEFPYNSVEWVKKLAKLAKKSGLDGIVASGKEASMIRDNCGNNFLIVTPGIRFKEEETLDQKRVTTPKEAISNGSDMIVMGSSLVKGGVPAVHRALAEIQEGLNERKEL